MTTTLTTPAVLDALAANPDGTPVIVDGDLFLFSASLGQSLPSNEQVLAMTYFPAEPGDVQTVASVRDLVTSVGTGTRDLPVEVWPYEDGVAYTVTGVETVGGRVHIRLTTV